ncbi:hypothetical protein Ate01nite_42320 [Actinoplanes teichomyceticus]|nr:hypothetical protein Ate01nite_42320 [Actinoplanes teichomyceticus]
MAKRSAGVGPGRTGPVAGVGPGPTGAPGRLGIAPNVIPPPYDDDPAGARRWRPGGAPRTAAMRFAPPAGPIAGAALVAGS